MSQAWVCTVFSGLLDRPLNLKEEDKENGLQIQFEIIQVSALKILSDILIFTVVCSQDSMHWSKLTTVH